MTKFPPSLKPVLCLLCPVLLGAFTAVRTAGAQTATLAADTVVTSAHPATNYGTLSNLYVSGTSTALLRFNLDTLPRGTTATNVVRATLRVFVNRVNTPGIISVSGVGAAWNEGAVTLQTLPVIGNAAEVFPVTDEGQFVTVDITPMVQAWVSTPATNFGVALASSAADVVFDSKENDVTAHSAQLDIALSSGSAGPAGPQGLKGDKGDTGAAGAAGGAGATGPAGPQGPAGIAGQQGAKGEKGDSGSGPGMQFEGAYRSDASYAKNNVVTYANAAWVSLHDSNVGHSPDASANDWSILVPAAASASGSGPAAAPASLTYAGVYASTTGYGTNQVVTWQSAAWVSLHDSNHGNTPDRSVSDWAILVPASTNPASITTVINGLLYEGNYTSATNYATNHVVTWQSSAWVSLHDSNHGNTPDGSALDWSVLVPAAVGLTGPQGPRGDKGDTGPQGERGFAGPEGDQGDRGATGDTGRPGFVYQGVYSSTTNYTAGDVVLWQGGSWASLHETNHGNTPSESPLDWGALTTRGLTGPTGEVGAQGPVGPQGPQGEIGSPGERGIVGPQGSPGPQGAAGRDGAQGVTGGVGPAGPQGAPGPVGLTWQGSYRSATNYATNDAVAFLGESWLSLHDANHGNAPGQSVADWTLLAAQGSTGPQGLQGTTGTRGPQGDTGTQGPRGDPGDAGAVGPAGPPGMTFRGTYDSAANYDLRDGVAFAGGSWISLAAANHGNTPGAATDWWQQIAAPGARGLTGAQGDPGVGGPQGPVGAQGPEGPAGPEGAPIAFRGSWSASALYSTGDAVFFNGSAYIATSAVNGNPPGVSPLWSLLARQGDAGAAGLAGPQGAPGAQGPAGPIGPQGLQGIAGIRWRGTYNPASGYSAGDAVVFGGSSYLSAADGNSGVTPGTGPQWSLLAAAGAVGTRGADGSNGLRGTDGVAATVQVGTVTTGLPGSSVAVGNSGTSNTAILNFSLPQGPAGVAGIPGLVFQGTWAAGTGYQKNDVTYRSGSAYVSQRAANTSDPAVAVANNTGDWGLLVAQGDAGPATVSIGSVTTGGGAAVTNIGTQNAAVLNFTLPRGDAGPAGPAGLTFDGSWNPATAYRMNDAVSYLGSTYIALAGNTNVQPAGAGGSTTAWALLASQGATGAVGSTGATGPAGSAPTIAVSATHTGAPGTDAVVKNVGTATSVQLEFTIPQGSAGTGGGSSGTGFYTTVHTVAPANAGLQVYSPVVDGHSGGDAFNVLGYLPATCRLNSVLVYNSSSSDARFEIHTGTPGNMSVTSAGACNAKAGTATTCPGPGLLGNNSFVSFGIQNAGSLASYLYTQFACN